MSISQKTILSLVVAISVLVAAPSYSLGAHQQQQPDSQQRPPGDDPIRELNLSAEQRQRIRAIREQLRDERAAVNDRLRETNRALEEALDADNPDEATVEQRLRDVAAAQAASMRIRVLSEVRILRVLTPEQLAILRSLRRNARGFRRERQRDNILRRRDGFNGQRGLPNQRNGLGPTFPRRGDPEPSPRP